MMKAERWYMKCRECRKPWAVDIERDPERPHARQWWYEPIVHGLETGDSRTAGSLGKDRCSMTDYIATEYHPTSSAGRAAMRGIGTLDRSRLAKLLRRIRRDEDGFSARHCHAWIDWLGGYPRKAGAA